MGRRVIDMSRLKLTKYRCIILLALAAMLITPGVNTGMAFDETNTTFFGVAIKGYDPVAYHTEGRAVKGKSAFIHYWNDAKWYFATAANRDLFELNPERYAPQYGGY
jgi:YHS domain-containing protein